MSGDFHCCRKNNHHINMLVFNASTLINGESSSNIGTGGMDVSVVLFNPRIHLFACTHPSVSNTFDCNTLLVYKHQSTALCSNTFGLWFLVCGQASVSSPVFPTRLDCGSLSVYMHQSPALCFKHVWIVVPCLCTCISLKPFCFKHVGLWFLVCVQASVLSQNGYGWLCLHGSDVDFVFLHVMSGVPNPEAGDGHEHGCLDALATTLSSSSEFEHLNFQLVIKQLKEAGLHSAEDLALAGCGDTLSETVIGQLLPENADEASRKALIMIFNVGRQALPGSTRLCLRQLWNQQGKPEVQTCTANSLFLCPLGLVFCRCGSVLKFIFLNSNHWVGILGFQRSGKLRPICRTHV